MENNPIWGASIFFRWVVKTSNSFCWVENCALPPPKFGDEKSTIFAERGKVEHFPWKVRCFYATPSVYHILWPDMFRKGILCGLSSVLKTKHVPHIAASLAASRNGHVWRGLRVMVMHKLWGNCFRPKVLVGLVSKTWGWFSVRSREPAYISHPRNRKIINSKVPSLGDMLVPRRVLVIFEHFLPLPCRNDPTWLIFSKWNEPPPTRQTINIWWKGIELKKFWEVRRCIIYDWNLTSNLFW